MLFMRKSHKSLICIRYVSDKYNITPSDFDDFFIGKHFKGILMKISLESHYRIRLKPVFLLNIIINIYGEYIIPFKTGEKVFLLVKGKYQIFDMPMSNDPVLLATSMEDKHEMF